jgi:hypothetical protein
MEDPGTEDVTDLGVKKVRGLDLLRCHDLPCRPIV